MRGTGIEGDGEGSARVDTEADADIEASCTLSCAKDEKLNP